MNCTKAACSVEGAQCARTHDDVHTEIGMLPRAAALDAVNGGVPAEVESPAARHDFNYLYPSFRA
jgi:hypothetical protein